MPEPPTWTYSVAQVLAVPAMALLWWALGFLAWQTSGLSLAYESLLPTLPVLLWPAAVTAGLVIAGHDLWRRAGRSGDA